MAFPKPAGAFDMVPYQGDSNPPLRSEHGRNYVTVRSVMMDGCEFVRQLRSEAALSNIAIIFQR